MKTLHKLNCDYLLDQIIDQVHQTPCLVYVESILQSNFAAMRDGLRLSEGDVEIYFALKSCYNRFVVDSLKRSGIGVEAMSALEFQMAKAVGFPGRSILLNGLGRKESLLKEAIESDATIILDSLGELQKIRHWMNENKKMRVRLGVRVWLSPLDSTSSYAHSTQKLGLTRNQVEEVLRFASDNERVELDLIHCHLTINQKNSDVFLRELLDLHKLVTELEQRFSGQYFKRIDIGGGYGTFASDEMDSARILFSQLKNCFKELFPGRTLVVEPGRYLSNSAGYVVATVLEIKKRDDRFVLIIDASTNVLVPIPSARYTLAYPKADVTSSGVCVSIVDGITSPDNVVISKTYLSQLPDVGSKMIIGNCGAYTDVLSHFWAFDPFVIQVIGCDGKMQMHRSYADIRKARTLLLGYESCESSD